MKCYFCATPYHLIAAAMMAAGMHRDDSPTLVLYNHFQFDDAFVKTLRQSGLYREVIVYNYSNASWLSNLKRAVNVIFQDPILVRLAKDSSIDEYIFFTLDFMAMTWLVQKTKKRQATVSLADDGMGSYYNSSIYVPRAKPMKVLRWLKRDQALAKIRRLYVYRPDFVITNRQFELVAIDQQSVDRKKLDSLISALWPMNDFSDFENCIVFFEQPFSDDPDHHKALKSVSLVKEIAEKTGRKIVIKMHPRSQNEAFYRDFKVLKTKAPFEAILWQCQNHAISPILMTVTSTIAYSPYFIDGLNVDDQRCILFLYQLYYGSKSPHLESFRQSIRQAGYSDACLHEPANLDELTEILATRQGCAEKAHIL